MGLAPPEQLRQFLRVQSTMRPFLVFLCATAVGAAAEAPAPPAPEDLLYDAAKQLFDQYAPPEVKAQYDFPSQEQFQDFAARLQQALDGDSIDGLAQYEPEARQILTLLRTLPGDSDYADWLSARLEEIDAARAIESEAKVRPSVPPGARPSRPRPGDPLLRRMAGPGAAPPAARERAGNDAAAARRLRGRGRPA